MPCQGMSMSVAQCKGNQPCTRRARTLLCHQGIMASYSPCSCALRVSPMLALPADFNKPTEMYQNGICLCFVLQNGCNSNRKNAERIFWPVIQVEKEKEKREEESRVTERVKMKASREDKVEIYLWVYGPHPSLFQHLYHVNLNLRALWLLLNPSTLIGKLFWNPTPLMARILLISSLILFTNIYPHLLVELKLYLSCSLNNLSSCPWLLTSQFWSYA